MNKIALWSLCILLTACTSNNNDKTTATGQQISKEEAKKLNLKPAGILQDLIKSQFNGMPQPGDFDNCEELLQQLEQNNIDIQSIKEREVIVVSNNKLLTYSFEDDTCLR